MTATTLTLVKRQTKPLISTEVRQRLIGQMARQHAMSIPEADRIVTATIGFLKICADNPNAEFRPSKRVDIGWHTFILNTVDYAEFCGRVAGRFLHHIPDEFTSPAEERRATAKALAPTVEALRAAGFDVDPELWLTDAADCTQCHAGCTSCGQGGDDPGRR